MAAIASSSKRGFSVADVQQSTANIARKTCIFSCALISPSDIFAFSISRRYAVSMLASLCRAWKVLITTKHQCQQSTVADGESRCRILQMMSNRGSSSSSKQLSRWWQKMRIPGHFDACSEGSPNSSSIAWMWRAVAWMRIYRSEKITENYEGRQTLPENLHRMLLRSSSKEGFSAHSPELSVLPPKLIQITWSNETDGIGLGSSWPAKYPPLETVLISVVSILPLNINTSNILAHFCGVPSGMYRPLYLG